MIRRMRVQLLFSLVILCSCLLGRGEETKVRLGGMFSNERMATLFKDRVRQLNETKISHNGSLLFESVVYPMKENPIRAALDVCENILNENISVVIVDQEESYGDAVVGISYTCGFYMVPIIGISSRDSMLSDKSIHPTFLRMVSPYSEQANVWIEFLKYYRWKQVLVIVSNEYESKTLYTKFLSLAKPAEIKVEKSIKIMADSINVTSELNKLMKTVSRVILLFSNSDDASLIYRDAVGSVLIGKDYVWLVSERAISNNLYTKAPLGSISCLLTDASEKERKLNESLRVIFEALESLNKEKKLSSKFLENGCESTEPWVEGKSIYDRLLSTVIDSETGRVSFDENGVKARDYEYKIVNKQESGLRQVGKFLNGNLSLNDPILWSAGSWEVPKGTFRSRHLRVVTVKEHPFVYVDKKPENGTCSDLRKGSRKDHEFVECSGNNFAANKDTYSTGVHCCSGFCISLLTLLAKKVNFTYDVHLSEDGQFGSHVPVPGTTTRKWNGMIGEILEDKADIIVASLTISNNRAEFIEYSKPFKYQGITILVKKNEERTSLDSFLRPFQIELWLLVLLSVHVVAVILYLLDRFSPFGRFQLAKSDKDETPLNLSSAMWFSWGVLLNSGIGEGTPRSFSARVLGMVWAGFAMIIIASYTANLAAFLVLDRPKAVVSGIDDPNLRNPSDSFKFATVANSSVTEYFRRQVELSSMYTFMEKNNVATAQEGIEAVKNGKLKAFIWDSAVLYHETSKDCTITTAGELFGRSGYGIGVRQKSPWTNDISLAILNYHESGVMERLETQWIDIGHCPDVSNAAATLGLSHMFGVFIMVLAGIGVGVIIIILEIIYHKHRGWRADQRDLAKKTTELWKTNVKTTKGENGKGNGKKSPKMNGDLATQGRINPIFDAQLY